MVCWWNIIQSFLDTYCYIVHVGLEQEIMPLFPQLRGRSANNLSHSQKLAVSRCAEMHTMWVLGNVTAPQGNGESVCATCCVPCTTTLGHCWWHRYGWRTALNSVLTVVSVNDSQSGGLERKRTGHIWQLATSTLLNIRFGPGSCTFVSAISILYSSAISKRGVHTPLTRGFMNWKPSAMLLTISHTCFFPPPPRPHFPLWLGSSGSSGAVGLPGLPVGRTPRLARPHPAGLTFKWPPLGSLRGHHDCMASGLRSQEAWKDRGQWFTGSAFQTLAMTCRQEEDFAKRLKDMGYEAIGWSDRHCWPLISVSSQRQEDIKKLWQLLLAEPSGGPSWGSCIGMHRTYNQHTSDTKYSNFQISQNLIYQVTKCCKVESAGAQRKSLFKAPKVHRPAGHRCESGRCFGSQVMP